VRIDARRCFESTHVWTVASPLVSAYLSNAAGFRTIEQNADRAVLIDLIESCEEEARKGGDGESRRVDSKCGHPNVGRVQISPATVDVDAPRPLASPRTAPPNLLRREGRTTGEELPGVSVVASKRGASDEGGRNRRRARRGRTDLRQTQDALEERAHRRAGQEEVHDGGDATLAVGSG
jgi:hypothetical protein